MKEKIIKKYDDISNFINVELNNICKWFDLNKIIAFITVLIVGLFTHIKMIVGLMATQDSLWNGMSYYVPGNWERALGRWGIPIVEKLNNYLLIPSIATISCILIIAIASVFVIDLYKIKNKLSVILISIFLIVSPFFTITFFYVHTSTAYCMAFLTGVLSVWFLNCFKYRKTGTFLSVVLFALTMGIYQSYIGTITGLIITLLIIKLIKEKCTIKEIIVDIIKSVVVIICGAIVYYLTTMCFLNYYNVEMSTYGGANEITIMNIIANLKTSFITTYVDFKNLFVNDEIFLNSIYKRNVLSKVVLIVFAIAYVIRCAKLDDDNRIKIFRIILSLICVCLIPPAFNIINIIIGRSNIYALTGAQAILVFPFIIALMEGIIKINVLYLIDIIVMIIYAVTYFHQANVSYTVFELSYNQAINVITKVLTEVEMMDEYIPGQKMMFAGIIDQNNYSRPSNLYNYSYGFAANNSVFHGDYSGQIATWQRILELYFGLVIPRPDEEQYKRIVESEEYKNMQEYPNQNSIKSIEDVIVVKFKDIPAMPY